MTSVEEVELQVLQIALVRMCAFFGGEVLSDYAADAAETPLYAVYAPGPYTPPKVRARRLSRRAIFAELCLDEAALSVSPSERKVSFDEVLSFAAC